MYLGEGLKEGDLQELVLNTLSIDEYESKLDDDSIVIAFSVLDRDPADDLNRFIQKGAVDILDTDVSPAPNEDGNYLVFVEILRDENFPEKALAMLGSINSLTGLDEWRAEIYDIEEPVEITLENLQRLVRLKSQEDHEGHGDEVQENLEEFFRASDLDSLVVEDGVVVLEARGVQRSLVFVDLGSPDAIYENNEASRAATRLDESALHNCRGIQRMLGDLWIAEQRGDYMVVAHSLGDTCGLFKLV